VTAAAGTGDGVVAFEPSLGRIVRVGSPAHLGGGSFKAALEALAARRYKDAAELVSVTVLEADELRDVFDRWPRSTRQWVLDQGAQVAELERLVTRLETLLDPGVPGIAEAWPSYVELVQDAAGLCRAGADGASKAVQAAHDYWMRVHDRAVDLTSGMVDVAVRLLGEDVVGDLWDHLMADWYAVHEQRYDLRNQPWQESARQLMVAVFDGFHAHLTGFDRSGDIEVIEETDRIGFRFAPCGSGGRSLAAGITDGAPRAAAPYNFAVTTRPHDWAWNKVGICSYCVHCCQLNERMPITRLGYPTRVIDPPTWPATDENPSCTWWVYRDPSLVPDDVYERVGATPDRRPARTDGGR
jgi:hypothetical protein